MPLNVPAPPGYFAVTTPSVITVSPDSGEVSVLVPWISAIVASTGSPPGSGSPPPATFGVGTASLKSLALWSVSVPVALRWAEVVAVRFVPVWAPSNVLTPVPKPTMSITPALPATLPEPLNADVLGSSSTWPAEPDMFRVVEVTRSGVGSAAPLAPVGATRIRKVLWAGTEPLSAATPPLPPAALRYCNPLPASAIAALVGL